ncbi:MAG TPA: hypothetical protein VGH76_04055 [Actinomycetospora sp.]|jgi:hypothetical protein|uniref:hypothetical protein n=1 Tax=Actinomycetospora sp. TaxID=1872135 RepID=UPI002F420D48
MARARHAMHAHPLRSKGVVVGIPVAAAVAFGAHTVLGVTPLSDQHGTQTSSATPQVGTSTASGGAPVQSYGLATAPPPTTLGLLSAPATAHGSAPASSGSSTSSPVTGHHAEAATQTVPVPQPAPAPSIMSFTPAAPPGAAPAAAAPVREVAAPASHTETPGAAAEAGPAPAAAHDDAQSSDSGSTGGSLLGLDLAGTKVSVLSFGE